MYAQQTMFFVNTNEVTAVPTSVLKIYTIMESNKNIGSAAVST